MFFDVGFNIYLSAGEIGKMNKKKLAKFKNMIQFQNTFHIKVQDAMNRYHFENLPETVSERVLLESLLWYGCAAFFEKDGSIFCLPCAPTGDGFNIYGEVGQVWVFSRNGMLNETVDVYIHGSDENAFLEKTNGAGTRSNLRGVVVWENATRYPFINQTLFFSQAISDSMRTLDVCRKNIKNPYVIVSEESSINTVKEFFDKRDNNEDYIISTGIFPVNKVNVLPLVTNSDNLNAITALIEWYESKYRELCGIDNNAQIDKKGENLIQAEVSINDQYTDMSIDKIIPYMQFGLDDVNKIFGTNIRVQKNAVETSVQEKGENDNDNKDVK